MMYFFSLVGIGFTTITVLCLVSGLMFYIFDFIEDRQRRKLLNSKEKYDFGFIPFIGFITILGIISKFLWKDKEEK